MIDGLFVSVPKTVARNLMWGAFWGICGGVVYSAYAVVLLILRGPAAFEANDTSFPAVLGAYLGGGGAAGLLLGLLRPLTRSWLGSAILGALCAVPVFSAGRIALSGFSNWTGDDWRG